MTTRRDFLRTGLAGGAILSLPASTAATILSQIASPSVSSSSGSMEAVCPI